MSTLLPYIEQDSPLMGVADTPPDSDFYKTDFLIAASLTEEQDIFMRTGSALLLGSSEALFQEVDADPNHFYKPLFQQVEWAHEFYKEKYTERNKRRLALSLSYGDRPPPLNQ